MSVLIEQFERKENQRNKLVIMDRHFISKKLEEKSANEAKNAKVMNWVIGIVGTIATLIEVFKWW